MSQAISHPQAPRTVPVDSRSPQIGVLIVAYNAVSTLAAVLDRIPKDFRSRIAQVFVCDDASQDSTYLVGLGYRQITDDLPLAVIRHVNNLGYGGNQKAGYRMAIERELDIIVLLHGDGQYAPEYLEEIVAPLVRGECDAVFGSRMLIDGAARKGGMPLYKYWGNRILTNFENRMLGTGLSEFHSGYRAYSVKALSSIPFEHNSDGFDFDTQVIIKLVDAGKRIIEVPIPTYYGDEVCHVDGIKYAKDVCTAVISHRLAKLGFTTDDLGHVNSEYGLKENEESSHTVVLRWLEQIPPARILDLGCSGGLLGERARALGHEITGVDVLEHPGVEDRVDRFIRGDLDRGLPPETAQHGPFDVILAADLLEHVRAPELVLEQARQLLAPRGILIASVPNFGHWYARGRTMLGLFAYDRRGILDQDHVRFFTRRSFLRTLRQSGFTVLRSETTGLPLQVLTSGQGVVIRALRQADRLAIALRPTLFGYQFVCQCEAL